MNAFQIPGLRFSLPSGAAIERYRFLSVNSEGNGVAATASTPIIGVSTNKVAAGEVLEIADGLVIVRAAGVIAAGSNVYSDATGKATATGTVIAGVAVTGATAVDNLVTVKL